jgi:hypothetical protein
MRGQRHPVDLRAQLRRPPELDLATAERVYHRLALLDLVQDVRIGLQLAFYRTFAVPRIARLLVDTGEIHAQPHKRSIDTGLFMYELIEAGFDSPRGRDVVRGLNRMHQRWHIRQEDYRYVLLCLMVVPTRWVNSYAPRDLTVEEIQATVVFYRELGRRMNIADLPETYVAAETVFDDYEARNVGYSDAGRTLMYETRGVMAEQLPWLLKRGAPLFTRLVLDDYVADAVGVRRAPPGTRVAGRAVRRVRTLAYSVHRDRRESYFTPGRKVNGVYPDGYRFDELGPTAEPD